MPRREEFEHDDKDEGYLEYSEDKSDTVDSDEELPEGVYYDDGPATMACRYCGAELFADASYCVGCATFQSKDDSPPDRKPMWIWVLLIVTLLASVWTAVR